MTLISHYPNQDNPARRCLRSFAKNICCRERNKIPRVTAENEGFKAVATAQMTVIEMANDEARGCLIPDPSAPDSPLSVISNTVHGNSPRTFMPLKLAC